MKLKKKKLLFAFLAGFFLVGQLGINNAVAEGHGGNNHGEEHHEGPPVFEDIDSDGDGLITYDEARAHEGDVPDFDEAKFQEFFHSIDADGNGSVDRGEFDAEVSRREHEGHDHEGQEHGGE